MTVEKMDKMSALHERERKRERERERKVQSMQILTTQYSPNLNWFSLA